jgi:hypothetical protein
MAAVGGAGVITMAKKLRPIKWSEAKDIQGSTTFIGHAGERICSPGIWSPKLAGWPNSAWYHLKLPGTSLTPMIVHVRFIGSPPGTCVAKQIISKIANRRQLGS